MRTFFDHAETEKMSRNDVTVDHQCNEWFLNKFDEEGDEWIPDLVEADDDDDVPACQPA